MAVPEELARSEFTLNVKYPGEPATRQIIFKLTSVESKHGVIWILRGDKNGGGCYMIAAAIDKLYAFRGMPTGVLETIYHDEKIITKVWWSR